MKKILFVATVVKTHIMEFHIPYLKMLKEMGWETAVASRNDYENPDDCLIPYCDTYYNIPFERNPFNPKNINAYKQLKEIIENGNYDIIHCHTPVGAMLTRLAATAARKHGTKVIYTAHGFHFYKGSPFFNWLAYYPVEKVLARKTDTLITINKEDYSLAKKKFKAGKIEYVPGVGIDTKKFGAYSVEHAQELRTELGIAQGQTVLLSVGEVNKNKNHSAVIKVLPYFPNVRYVVCGRGPLLEDNIRLAERLNVADRVNFVGYRSDVVDFYGMADIFIFPSLREGLPVALMEAMASGIPCVAAKNRGSNDLLCGSKLLFNVFDEADLKDKLQEALTGNPGEEVKINRAHLENYRLENVLSMVKAIYLG